MDVFGARGAIPLSDYRRRDDHATMYYEAVRKMKTDVQRIAKNTGFSPEDIEKVKAHIFTDKHELGGKKAEMFTPDYHMALSWQRLIDGKNIEDMDIVLLNHELKERKLMIESGMDYATAHKIAESEYNYKALADLKDGVL